MNNSLLVFTFQTHLPFNINWIFHRCCSCSHFFLLSFFMITVQHCCALIGRFKRSLVISSITWKNRRWSKNCWCVSIIPLFSMLCFFFLSIYLLFLFVVFLKSPKRKKDKISNFHSEYIEQGKFGKSTYGWVQHIRQNVVFFRLILKSIISNNISITIYSVYLWTMANQNTFQL